MTILKLLNAQKFLLLSVLVIGAISGAAASYLMTTKLQTPKTKNDLIREFYEVENAVHVSPHSIRKMMDKGDKSYVLVDLRSKEEYDKEHIIGAVSIPAYKDKDTSDYGAVDRIVGEFQKLPKDKDIIVYCYSIPCMTGRKVGAMLIEHEIYVKHLGIGWNEWRHFWNLWNHEHEWAQTNVKDYTGTGSEPGTPKVKVDQDGGACPIDNQFGC